MTSRKFNTEYLPLAPLLYRIAFHILEQQDEAEDAVQETFLALTRHLGRVEEVDSAGTRKFLMTIAKSKAIDILRREKRAGEISSEELEYHIPDGKPDLLDSYISEENYNRLISCVLELDEMYRMVFEYRYVHQLSEKEIADLLGISTKAVGVRFLRARRKLQEMLQKEVAGDAR
jgi:RNA polymerase sigma-70 factor (ECF subfamily)